MRILLKCQVTSCCFVRYGSVCWLKWTEPKSFSMCHWNNIRTKKKTCINRIVIWTFEKKSLQHFSKNAIRHKMWVACTVYLYEMCHRKFGLTYQQKNTEKKTPCGNSFSPLTFLIQLNSSNRACINEKYTLESNFKVSLSCNAHGWISVDFYYFEQIEKQNSLICDQVCNQTFIKYTHTHIYCECWVFYMRVFCFIENIIVAEL